VGKLTKSNQDARWFASMIKEKFKRANVITQVFANVTKKQFVGALTKLSKTVKADDLVFIYYSGHGALIPDNNGDESSGMDAVFIPYDVQNTIFKTQQQLDNAIIRDDQYAQLINAIGTKNIISVIDACYSGTMRKDILKGQVKYFHLPRINQTKGVYEVLAPEPDFDTEKGLVFAAADKDELAIETSKGSLFTLALLAVLDDKEIKNNHFHDVFKRAKALVYQASDHEQNPVAFGDKRLARQLKMVSSSTLKR
jgi:uncharacterized caspase-like protein